jgi:hypothetical protein
MTFLEFVIERHNGPPAHRSANSATWHCPFHNDSHPSFCTRPHRAEYKDRWICYGCGMRGDEFDFLEQWYPHENYGDRLERLRVLREEYKAAGLENNAAIYSPGMGSTAGVTTLRALLRAGQVDHCDLLEVLAELNHRRQLALECERLGRKKAS